MQTVVIVLMLAIVASLGKAMMHMGRADRDGRMVRALTARIVLSMALFGLLYLGHRYGWLASRNLR